MAEIIVEATQGETKRAVLKGLRAFNRGKAGDSRYKALTVSVRAEGRIVGGLVGDMRWSWAYVDLLWVDERHRGGGMGRRLIEAAQAQARDHGCTNIYLGTFTFQAPGFYEKMGFREFGRLQDYPAGFDSIFLTKAL